MIFFLAARFEAALTFLHPGKKEASIYFACVILLIDSRAFPVSIFRRVTLLPC